jgi:hypothetical protein
LTLQSSFGGQGMIFHNDKMRYGKRSYPLLPLSSVLPDFRLRYSQSFANTATITNSAAGQPTTAYSARSCNPKTFRGPRASCETSQKE